MKDRYEKLNIEQVAYNLAVRANTSLRQDVLFLLKNAYEQERIGQVRKVLKIIIDNARIARREGIAICQDTGLPLVFIEAGDVFISKRMLESIHRGITAAYREEGFRSSTVNPFSDKTWPDPQIVHIEFVPRLKGIRLTVFPKGFGSENKSRLKMFNPTDSFDKICDFVVASVKEAGPAACPPFIIGIGIGGTSDYALYLAKKALLERVDRPNSDKTLDRWEKKILQAINSLKIGPMGMGGKFTALAVKIKIYPTHIAGLPVGVNISCHALRSASAVIRI